MLDKKAPASYFVSLSTVFILLPNFKNYSFLGSFIWVSTVLSALSSGR